MDHYILELPNFVSPELCNEIVRRTENDERAKPENINYKLCNDILTLERKSDVLSIADHKEYEDLTNLLCSLFYDIYHKYTEHLDTTFKPYNKDYYNDVNPFVREIHSNKDLSVEGGFLVHKIKTGDYYLWHHDQEWKSSCNFVQVIIYLNTLKESEDGCTEFLNGRKVKPEIGKVLVYPRSWTFLHKGNKVSEGGVKYICTGNIATEFIK